MLSDLESLPIPFDSHSRTIMLGTELALARRLRLSVYDATPRTYLPRRNLLDDWDER
jgi:hypothetical protein